MSKFEDAEPYSMELDEFYDTDSCDLSIMMERHNYRLEIPNVIGELGVSIGPTNSFTKGVRVLPNFSRIVPEVRLIDNNQRLLGECVPSNQRLLHNSLDTDFFLAANRVPAATAMLNMMEHMVGRLSEENISGYDLMMFYIRRGYVPANNNDFLLSSLADYVVNKTPFSRESLPIQRLVYDPVRARSYWGKIRVVRTMGEGL